MTNLVVTAAYKIALLSALISDANLVVERLHLPGPFPITQKEIRGSYICPPAFGFGGTLQTETFEFNWPDSTTWGEGSKLCYLQRLDKFQGLDLRERNAQLAKIKSLLDTNAAFQLATQWLAAFSVDLKALAREKVTISQQRVYTGPSEDFYFIMKQTNFTVIPIFDVYWGKDEKSPTPVWMQILGSTRELLILRVEDPSLIIRPPIILTNAIHLLSQKDPPFKQMTGPKRNRDQALPAQTFP